MSAEDEKVEEKQACTSAACNTDNLLGADADVFAQSRALTAPMSRDLHAATGAAAAMTTCICK